MLRGATAHTRDCMKLTLQLHYRCNGYHKRECLSVLWEHSASQVIHSSVYKDGLDKNLPERISRVVDLPVSREDDLSPYLWQTLYACIRRVQAAETFRSMAKSNYEKQDYNKPPPPLHSPLVRGPRKRVKDTSGFEASPHTAQARPLHKRSTLAVSERKLTFPSHKNSKIL